MSKHPPSAPASGISMSNQLGKSSSTALPLFYSDFYFCVLLRNTIRISCCPQENALGKQYGFRNTVRITDTVKLSGVPVSIPSG